MSGAPSQVVVVGGGITGLAAAHAVQEQAAEHGLRLSCTVIESDPHWGGKILTRRVHDLVIEAGPDSFLSQKPWALELCDKLGLADRLVNTNDTDTKAFVYSRGRLRELPEGMVVIVPSQLGPFLRSGLVSWAGMARMGLDLALPAGPPDEDESLAAFFTRRLGREAFERLVEPLMAGIYAGDADQMSLRATFPRFLEIEQRHGSLIRGMLAARRRAAVAPAAAPRRTMFVTLRGGLAELVETLVGRITAQGGRLLPGERVSGLRACGAARDPQTYQVALSSGDVLRADAVVLATPAYVTADLLRPINAPAAVLLFRIPYASTATVSLAYPQAQVASRVRGFGFVVPRVEGRPLLAATWTSQKWSGRAPAGQVLVRVYLGGVGRETVLEAEDDGIVRLVRDELRHCAGLEGGPLYTEVHRWWRGMPQYTVGHLDRLALLDAAMAEQPGLVLAGAAYRGIGVPDCIRDGRAAAAAVCRRLASRPNRVVS